MGSFSIWHWLIVLLVVVLIFGTKKLRNIGADLGGAVKGFKDGMKSGSEGAADPAAPSQQVTNAQRTGSDTVDVEAKTKGLSPGPAAAGRALPPRMLDFGFDKLALIGAVALIVIGPEKLPKVARTVGHLLGKAQRYVADVKAEVNRSIELDELKKMRSEFETAARDVENTVRNEVNEAASAFDKDWKSVTAGLDGTSDGAAEGGSSIGYDPPPPPVPGYRHPKKNWRLKRGATPQWYKQRHGLKTRVQSGAARVARYRPPGLKLPR